jgi:ubiquinone/menaquinone biosynthesis C-methylase UbiE
MSVFHNYSEAAGVYDQTRQAVAYELWVGALERFAPAALSETRLLDAGCGTGNYAAAIFPYIGRVNGIDFNPDMLKQAQAKLADGINAGKAAFEQGSLLALPFESGTFDAVMINQVLHHLEGGDDPARNGHRAAVNEVARVLKPGGVFMVNACSHRQLRDGFWYNQFIPTALDRTCRRIAPTAMFAQMLNEAGFEIVARHVPVHAIMQGEAYFDMAGPSNPDWRRGDSIWSLAPEEELTAACGAIEKLISSGQAEEWFATRDAQRAHIGQLTFWIVVKRAIDG